MTIPHSDAFVWAPKEVEQVTPPGGWHNPVLRSQKTQGRRNA